MYEIELRGKLTEDEYARAKDSLEKVARAGQNDKLSQFFKFEGGILKVSRHESGRKTVLSLKLGDETRNNLQEFEADCAYDAFDSAVKLLEQLGYEKRELVEQRRIDYVLDNGCTISLKHTNDWGYHFEAEMLGKDKDQEAEIRKKIERVCQEFNLRYMTEQELTEFLQSIRH